MAKSGFKIPDQAQGPRYSGITYLILKALGMYQASGRSGKRTPPEADDHLPETCAAP